MMTREFLLTSLLVALLTICSCSKRISPQENAPLNKEFEILLGETLSVSSDNLIITFDAFAEDSLCPPSTSCIWAGRLKVNIRVDSKVYSLGINSNDSDISVDITYLTKKYRISLEDKIWSVENNPKSRGILLKVTSF